MPEVDFQLAWPDGTIMPCRSPSTAIRQHLPAGTYTLPDFLDRARRGLQAASDRVRAVHGFACARAAAQLRQIEAAAANFAAHPAAVVTVKMKPEDIPMDQQPTHVPAIVIGGGQAGLSASFLLQQRGLAHVVFERSSIASTWRTQRWDSFCLVTPNWQCQLPGFPYAGPEPFGFMPRADIVNYIESYAKSFNAPVRNGVTVHHVRRANGAFLVETSAGTLTTDAVICAVGGYHRPRIPPLAAQFPASIIQLHSSHYRNPAQLPPGAVLIVGTGQSGCQIAEDLHLAGRTVHLCTGSAPRVARRYRGRDVVEWLNLMGHYDLPVEQHPQREKVRGKSNHYVTGRDGGRDIDLRRFALEGMRLHGRLAGLAGAMLQFGDDLAQNLDRADASAEAIKDQIDTWIAANHIDAPMEARYTPVWQPEASDPPLDLAAANITTVIWSTGFHTDFSWIDAPIFDAAGYPAHKRGVTPQPGLYFLGLPWLHTWGSGRFSGIARDAEFVVADLAAYLVKAVAA
jgi:putative flavoprotein involved in K+ transport